jgi:myo-inositol catabolism protein IolH
MGIIDRIQASGIVAVVNPPPRAAAGPLAPTITEAGVAAIEITFRAEGAAAAIVEIVGTIPDALAGAGTVLTVAQATEALNAGARFIMSPGTNPAVVEYVLGSRGGHAAGHRDAFRNRAESRARHRYHEDVPGRGARGRHPSAQQTSALARVADEQRAKSARGAYGRRSARQGRDYPRRRMAGDGVMKLALDPAMPARRPVEEAVTSAAEAGYPYIELGNRADVIPAFRAVEASRGDLVGIRRAAASGGVEFASIAVIQAWSSPDEDLRLQAIAWWRDRIAAAVELGCSRINTEMSGDPGCCDESRAALFRSLEELLPVLDPEGIEVVAEPHPGDFTETTADALDLVRWVASDRFRYLHCIPHTFYLGGSAAQQIEQARGHFDHVHVADTYRPEAPSSTPLGSQLAYISTSTWARARLTGPRSSAPFARWGSTASRLSRCSDGVSGRRSRFA